MQSAVGTLAGNQHALDAIPRVDNDPVVPMNLLMRQVKQLNMPSLYLK